MKQVSFILFFLSYISLNSETEIRQSKLNYYCTFKSDSCEVEKKILLNSKNKRRVLEEFGISHNLFTGSYSLDLVFYNKSNISTVYYRLFSKRNILICDGYKRVSATNGIPCDSILRIQNDNLITFFLEGIPCNFFKLYNKKIATQEENYYRDHSELTLRTPIGGVKERFVNYNKSPADTLFRYTISGTLQEMEIWTCEKKTIIKFFNCK